MHHWDVSTKSMLERRWFFVDRRIQILAQPGGRPIYELQSIHSAKKRKPDETVNLQHSKTGEFQQRLTGFSKIAKGFRGSLWVFCRESFSTTPSGSSLFKLCKLGSIYHKRYWNDVTQKSTIFTTCYEGLRNSKDPVHFRICFYPSDGTYQPLFSR